MPPLLSRWLPLVLVTVAAAGLRCRDLATRPMHADEANQAVKAGQLLESGRYEFDPRDHHGPVLYYSVLPVAWCRGQRSLAQLDEAAVRLVPALAGTAAVFLLGLLAAPLGRWPACAAAAFLAVSPPSVYYSRYFVQEALLVAFILAALVCARRWWSTGRSRWAWAVGACLGLMQATKESAPFFASAAMIAWLVARPRKEPGITLRWGRDLLFAAVAAVVVAAAFYSSFGAHWGGLRDALLAYPELAARLGAGDTGHEKPWWYFLRLFAWQKNGGLVFEQVGFAVLAVTGFGVAWSDRNPLLRWAAVYSLLVLLALSATAYKTPWHAIQLVPGLALLAAGTLAALGRIRHGGAMAMAVTAVVGATLLFQADRVTRAYAADPRNPYAYVHSSPDVLKFRARAEAALGLRPDQPVRVISEEYWPLPWYFRGLPNVGYWTTPPADCDGALVIASAGLAEAVRARLHGVYRETFLGLRPGFVCVVFTPQP